jgi:hypothetical protein
MGTMIVIVCVSAGLNLALWGALYVRLDGLPLRLWSLAKKERSEDDEAALTLLQERAAAKAGAIVESLRDYDEQVAASFRAQVAEAQVRARIAERQSSEAGVALSAASALVRELRWLLDRERVVPGSASQSTPAAPEGRATIPPAAIADDAPVTPPSTRPGDDGRRSSSRPPPPLRLLGCEPPSGATDDGERPSENELTRVLPRRLLSVADAGPTLISPTTGKRGAR